MMLGNGVVKTWSNMQTTIVQSSGEADYYALVRAAAEGLGMQSIMHDLGWKMRIRVWVDSSAAKSIASRIGLGRVRHLEVKFLWLQEVVRDKRLEVKKVHGTQNPAGIRTKSKAPRKLWKRFRRSTCERLNVKSASRQAMSVRTMSVDTFVVLVTFVVCL